MRSPRHRRSDHSSAPNMSEWTVTRLKHFLSQNNIPFHRTDKKARLFQLYTNSLQDSTLSRPSSHDLLGSRRRACDDVRDVTARRSATRTPSSSATSASPPHLHPMHIHPITPASLPPLWLLSLLPLPSWPSQLLLHPHQPRQPLRQHKQQRAPAAL
eukprot:superscaffoldBa00007664_g22733